MTAAGSAVVAALFLVTLAPQVARSAERRGVPELTEAGARAAFGLVPGYERVFRGTNDVTIAFYNRKPGEKMVIDGMEHLAIFKGDTNTIINYWYECPVGSAATNLMLFHVVHRFKYCAGVMEIEGPTTFVMTLPGGPLQPIYVFEYGGIELVRDGRGGTNSVLVLKDDTNIFRLKIEIDYPEFILRKYQNDIIAYLAKAKGSNMDSFIEKHRPVAKPERERKK